MRYRDVLRFSLRGIRTSPLRSALSALSVAVGTGALLIIASLGLFGRTQIENGLARIGVSGLAVSTDEGGRKPRPCGRRHGPRRTSHIRRGAPRRRRKSR